MHTVFRLGAFFLFKASLSVSLFPLLYFSSLFFTFAVFSFCFSPPPWGSIFSFLFPLFSSFFLLASFLNSSSIFGEEREYVEEKSLQQGGTRKSFFPCLFHLKAKIVFQGRARFLCRAFEEGLGRWDFSPLLAAHKCHQSQPAAKPEPPEQGVCGWVLGAGGCWVRMPQAGIPGGAAASSALIELAPAHCSPHTFGHQLLVFNRYFCRWGSCASERQHFQTRGDNRLWQHHPKSSAQCVPASRWGGGSWMGMERPWLCHFEGRTLWLPMRDHGMCRGAVPGWPVAMESPQV